MKPIRTISIISGNPADNGRRIKLGLFRVDGAYRWFGGSTGQKPAPEPEQDSEVSGRTVAEACRAARQAWAGTAWGLKAKASEF